MSIKNLAYLEQRFRQWWECANTSPLLRIVGNKDAYLNAADFSDKPSDPYSAYTDAHSLVAGFKQSFAQSEFLAEAYPCVDLNLGPGSLALYLGSEPGFTWETVWFKECVHGSWSEIPHFKFDDNNKWFKKHIEMFKTAKELSNNDYILNIPDIVENIDILAAMKGPQNLCLDLYDEPDSVKERIKQLDDLYFKYYDEFYNIVKLPDNLCGYTAFNIIGKGRVAKVQCDFNVLLSPFQFREFVLESLRNQCKVLDYSVFHTDGPDAIKHIDALIEIDELNAIQWTHGAGNPDGLDSKWFEPIYDKVKKAGKSLMIFAENGNADEWIEKTDRIIDRYGTKGIYIQYPKMSQEDAYKILNRRETSWSEN